MQTQIARYNASSHGNSVGKVRDPGSLELRQRHGVSRERVPRTRWRMV
jgi:hypothetical protein